MPQNIAVIPGDGIGPEVVTEGLKVLKAVVGDDAFDFTHYDLGAERWQRTGEVLPESVLGRAGPGRRPDPRRGGCRPRFEGDPVRTAGARPAAEAPLRLRPLRQPAAVKLYPGITTPLSDAVVARGPVDKLAPTAR